MKRLLTTSLLAAVLTVALPKPFACAEGAGAASAQGLAARAVELISRGEIRRVAEMMHYPPKYTPEERQGDMSSTGGGLELLASEFGAISAVKPHTGLAMYYRIGGTGGDVPYVSSLSPHYSAEFLYSAKFAKRGDGYIAITVIQLTPRSKFEVLGVYFGLPTGNPHSKPAILAIARKQLIQMKVPITPDVERQMEASLKPVRFSK